MKVTLLFLSLFSCSIINAQTGIRGRVIDSTNAPLPYISVALLHSKDSVLVKGSVSNDKGEYSFEKIRSGNYLIKAIMVGAYESFSTPFLVDSMIGFQVPDLTISSKGTVLKEVAITDIKQTIEFKDGMVVMNVEDNPVNAGNTVLELLAKIPGVTVDNEGNISLDGRSGITIMIDGRIQHLAGQQLVSLLRSMSSESLSKIEVMRNPPAKYDAAGTSGMINIISKKVKTSGWSGSVNASGNKGHRYNGSVDASLNYKGKKITIFTNVGYVNNLDYRHYIWNKKVPADSGITKLDEDGAQFFYSEPLRFKTGINYDLSDKTTAGFLISGVLGSSPYDDIGINQIKGYNNLGFDHSPYINETNTDWFNPNYNINLEHSFDTAGTTLSFSADYSDYAGKSIATNYNSFLDAGGAMSLPDKVFRTTRNNNIVIATQKLDFTRNLTKKLLFETGLKNTSVSSASDYVFEKQDNLTGEYVQDTAISNKSQYNEKVIAGYISFRREIKNGSFQAGGRGENTSTDIDNKTEGYTITRNYFKFFPNISFTYSRSENHSFQFNVSRRIDRPNYKDLNPYILYMDNYTQYKGNPDLLPQTGYNFSGEYTFRKFLTNTLTYTRFENCMFGYEYQYDSIQVSAGTVKNLEKAERYAYNLFLQKKFTKWWSGTVSGSFYYSLFEGMLEGAPFKRTIFSGNANITSDIILPRQYKINVNVFYYGPNNSGTDRNEGFWGVTAGIRKAMFKEKLFVNLSVSDIFNTMVFNVTSKFLTQDYYMITKNDTRRLRLTLQYRFGKVKVRSPQVSSNDDEKNRLENR